MSVLTIHAEDCLAFAVREYAEKAGKSINAAVKELLSSALGIGKTNTPAHDFSEFCGIIDKNDAEEIRNNMKGFETIDEELWK